MRQILRVMWNLVTAAFIQEQSIYIMFYSIFVSFFSEYDKQEIEVEEFLQKNELLRLVQIQDYDLKEAFFSLEEAIDWISVLEFPDFKLLKEELYNLLQAAHINDAQKVMLAVGYMQEFMEENGTEYTPKILWQLITELSLLKPTDSVADYCAGFGTLGIEVCRAKIKENGTSPVFGAFEINRNYCAIIKILAEINGIKNWNVQNRNILEEEKESDLKYDLILADIPKGMNNTMTVDVTDRRFMEYKMRSVYAEWFFVMDAISHLTERGRVFAIVSKGALVRKNERDIRKKLVDRDMLEAVITLPPGLYAGTNMAMELVILDMDKREKERVFLGTLFQYVQKAGRNQNTISQNGIAEILKAYRMEDKAGIEIGRWVSNREIAEQNYSLNTLLYLELDDIQKNIGESVQLGEVAQVMRGVQLKPQDEEMLRDDATHYLLNVKNINEGQIFYDEMQRIRGRNVGWSDKYEIREDDIVITAKGSLIKVAIVPPNPPKAYITGNLTIVRVDKSKYHPYLLYEFLISSDGIKSMESIQTGSTIKVLNVSQLKSMKIPDYKLQRVVGYAEELKQNDQQYRKALKIIQKEYIENKKSLMQKIREENVNEQ